MTTKSNQQSTDQETEKKGRVKVGNLPNNKELTSKEAKQVKGGVKLKDDLEVKIKSPFEDDDSLR